jgi:hypothetical protein
MAITMRRDHGSFFAIQCYPAEIFRAAPWPEIRDAGIPASGARSIPGTLLKNNGGPFFSPLNEMI